MDKSVTLVVDAAKVMVAKEDFNVVEVLETRKEEGGPSVDFAGVFETSSGGIGLFVG